MKQEVGGVGDNGIQNSSKKRGKRQEKGISIGATLGGKKKKGRTLKKTGGKEDEEWDVPWGESRKMIPKG